MFTNKELKLAVVCSSTRWIEDPRIRHQITRQLLREYNVLYLEVFPTEGFEDSTEMWEPVNERLVIFRPKLFLRVSRRLYANSLITHKLVNVILARIIESQIKKLGGAHVFCNFLPDFQEIMKTSSDIKIYFCYDEWPKMWRQSTKPVSLKFHYQSFLMKIREIRTARQSNIILCSHILLCSKWKELGLDARLFLHGHEFQDQLDSRREQLSYGKQVSSKKIKVCFMGYITYNLLHEWLRSVLMQDDFELHLIGPINSNHFDIEKYGLYSNFFYHGSIKDIELFEKLREMDVMIMPYNPAIPEVYVQTVSNKFFQYIASLKPVVISKMPYYLKLPRGILYVSNDCEEFIKNIRDAFTKIAPN